MNGDETEVVGNKEGLIIKLISIDGDTGFFKDSVGADYTMRIYQQSFYYAAPVSEIERSKKFILNKTIWMRTGIMGKSKEPYNFERIEAGPYAAVKVVNAFPSYSPSKPLMLEVKTAKSETGYFEVNLSGTNILQLRKNWFYTNFLLEDPRIKYHISPVNWKKILAGTVAIGMTTDEVKLIKGDPDRINSTTTKAGVSQQYVYGDTNGSYYYFTHDKLTSFQN